MMYQFDAVQAAEQAADWVREYFAQCGASCAVIGISGGKDSSVAAALCTKALGAWRVCGVLMPQYEQNDIRYSYDLVQHLGISSMTIDIGPCVNAICESISHSIVFVRDQTRVNLPARIRMSTLFAVAQSVNGRVANTCNLSEDWVGYSTLFGDNAGQFAPLKAFTATEVKAIGRELGLPQMFLEKPPADGLCGRTDEENLGFSYAALDRYIRENICEDKGVKQKIDALHAANQFKEEFVRLPFFPPGREIFYHGEQPCQTLTSSSQTIIKRS